SDQSELRDDGSWLDPSLVMFTSGTTGQPKAGLASNAYLIHSAQVMLSMREAGEDEVFWSPLPMYHANPLLQIVLAPLMVGAEGAIDRRFSVSAFWDRVRAVGATQLSVLGTMIQLLWNRPAQPD